MDELCLDSNSGAEKLAVPPGAPVGSFALIPIQGQRNLLAGEVIDLSRFALIPIQGQRNSLC